MKPVSKQQIATAIAILFHAVGLAGILFVDTDLFARLSPLNLLLSFALILYTHQNISKKFMLFIALIVVLGILAEIVGTSTGLLFGEYAYGEALGLKILEVPLIIGINWFIIIYCCGTVMQLLMQHFAGLFQMYPEEKASGIRLFSLLVDGATLAVFFDWLLEPVAVQLDFWHWKSGAIPVFNYLSWFVISVIFLFIFHKFQIGRANKFALHLLLVQAMFFLLLNALL